MQNNALLEKQLANNSNLRYRYYYRYQDDKQKVIERTPEQKKIFDEYFVIKNDITKKKPLLLISLALFLIGMVFLILFFAKLNTTFLIFGIIGLFIGFIFSVIYNKMVNIYPKKIMSHEEYEKLVDKKIESLKVKDLALSKLNLDPEQVSEIEPIIIRNKVVTDTSLIVYDAKNKLVHSSTNFVAVLYFTDTQVLTYKIQFDMCCNEKEEWSSELFYQDICDVSSLQESNIITCGKDKFEYNFVNVNIISINSSISFALNNAQSHNSKIQAMRQKIRDKKLTLEAIEKSNKKIKLK